MDRGPSIAEIRNQLVQLTQIGIALTAERDVERLLDRILREARRITRAEAGTLYVREGELLRFSVVQNDARPELNLGPRQAETLPPVPIDDRSVAGHVARTGLPLLIDDAYALPGGAAYAFNTGYDERTGYITRSMMVLPMREPDGSVIGVVQLINARGRDGEPGPFDAAMTELMLAVASQAAVALHNAQLAARLRKAYEETVFRLARAAEMRDKDTGEHVRRVAHYARALALRLGLGAERADDLLLASPLHDVGKIAVSDAILRKPGKLTPEERAEMERHTIYGAELLEGSDLPPLRLAREIALNHHERWDGRGYPRGLAGTDIPLAARITAVVDVFDALTSRRVYKEAIPLARAFEILQRDAGGHFDPEVVAAFSTLGREVDAIRERYAD
ncbi:MAG: phosphohydrolase [Planctomycetota bacterium]|nr:MAG: phosphohydrolase [Planctomycetota bacterium]